MNDWMAVALGMLQGVTEFLPISSDGHLALGAALLGLPDLPLLFVVLLHAGTLLATVVIFGPDLRRLARAALGAASNLRTLTDTDEGHTLIGIVIGSIPTAIIGWSFEHAVEQLSTSKSVVGLCLLGSALAVWSTRWSKGSSGRLSMWGYFLVGVAQGLAVLPGLSRSGSTIAAAMLLGMSGRAAFRFSFLLSIPAVCGAIVLKAADASAWSSLPGGAAIGAGAAFVTGCLALLLLRGLIAQGNLWVFALYLIPLGMGAVLWGLMG